MARVGGLSLARLTRRVLKSRAGSIAPLFALMVAPLALAAGATLDVSRAISTRSDLQEAVDATALGLSHLPTTTPQATLQIDAEAWIAAELGSKNIGPINVTVTPASSQITVSATANLPTTVIALAGISELPVNTGTTVQWGASSIEVALVLDNTYSMSASLDGTTSKLATLKTAATNLIAAVMTPANAGSVKVGVVPYADYVNVGTSNRSQPWISVAADYSTTTAKVCQTLTTKSTTTCSGGHTSTCSTTNDGIVTTYSCTVGQTCTTQTTTVAPYQSCTGGNTTNYKWYGCVYNQVQSNGSIAMPDPTTPYNGMPPDSNGQLCLNAITPLTTSSTTATAAVNALVDSIGSYKPETYIPGGLTWGINVLSPAAPFTEGAAYDPKNKLPRKALVLMTDGANTEYLKSNGTVAIGTATQVAKTYTDEQALCTYAKGKKIEVYTIGVGVTDPTALSNLESCATDSAHYFNAQSSSSLLSAFSVIAGSLQNLRISN